MNTVALETTFSAAVFTFHLFQHELHEKRTNSTSSVHERSQPEAQEQGPTMLIGEVTPRSHNDHEYCLMYVKVIQPAKFHKKFYYSVFWGPPDPRNCCAAGCAGGGFSTHLSSIHNKPKYAIP